MKHRTVSRKTVVRLLWILGAALGSWVLYRAQAENRGNELTVSSTDVASVSDAEENRSDPGTEGDPEEEDSVKLLGVHVSGAVVYPDQVWYLPEGSRIADAIEMAGGPLKSADLTRLNLADYITDSMRIYVPYKGEDSDPYTGHEGLVIRGGETESGNSSGGEQNSSSNLSEADLTNINFATKIELMALPGIGEAFAERIIRYREENGPFSSIEDIMKVEGIGEKKFEQIRNYITV